MHDQSEDAKRHVATTRAALMALSEAGGPSRARIAREAGVAESTLSQFMSESYAGDNAAVARKLAGWIQTHRALEAQAMMRAGEGFHETKTGRRILDALLAAQRANKVALVAGAPGVGKSRAAEHYAATGNNVWLVVMVGGARSEFQTLRTICRQLGIPMKGSEGATDLHELLVEKLADKRGLLIVDEAQHLSEGGLDAVRQIHDRAKCGLALIGHASLAMAVKRMPQLASRVLRSRVINSVDGRGDVPPIAAPFGVSERETLKVLADYAQGEGGLRTVFNVLLRALERAFEDGGRAISREDVTAAYLETQPEGV